jgi:hypothetical protein
MQITETIEGPITVTKFVHRFVVERDLSGAGTIQFILATQMSKDGEVFGSMGAESFAASFADLPATFPVTINGNVVQVSGQTILDALDAVAKHVVDNQQPG